MPLTSCDPVFPSDQDTILAQEVSVALKRAGDSALRVQVGVADREVKIFELPPMVARLLADILKETAAGHAVSLVPLQAEMTTQQAAVDNLAKRRETLRQLVAYDQELGLFGFE